MNNLSARIANLSPQQREFLLRQLNKYNRDHLYIPRAPVPTSTALEETAGLPFSPLEEVIVAIWEERLEQKNIDMHTPFRDLGGDDELAVRVLADIQQLLGLSIPFKTLPEGMTVKYLAYELQQQGKSTSRSVGEHLQSHSSMVAIQPLGARPPLFCVHPIGGDVSCYVLLAHYLGAEQPVYGLQAQGMSGEQKPARRIEDMAQAYISALYQVHPEGPYRLCGWSMGGVVAFEMAQQLCEQGRKVDFLGLLDTPVTVPPTALGNHQRLVVNFVQSLLPLTVEELERLTPGQQIYLLLKKARAHREVLQGISLLQWLAILHVYRCNAEAQQRYLARPYPGHVTLFHAQQLLGDPLDPPAEPERWNRFATEGVDVHFVAGNHGNMLSEPYVQQVAYYLHACLQRLSDIQ